MPVVRRPVFFQDLQGPGRVEDYYLRHSDLAVTIANAEDAAFYTIGAERFLHHGPEALGLSESKHAKRGNLANDPS